MTEEYLQMWSVRRQGLKQRYIPPTPELWPWLKETNLEFGCGPAALEAIDALSRGAAAVVTGQQAGLLTGPLYTIYKAASAVILARSLSEELQEPVAPVFWLASEDHDFQEVRSAWFPAGEKLEQITFPGEYSLTPAASIQLSQADVQGVMDRLKDILPATEFTEDLLRLVSDSAGTTFSAWCGGIISRLFREEGLVILDSCGLPVRLAAKSVFTNAIENGPEIHRVLAKRAAEMRAEGLSPGLDVPPNHSHLFLLREGQRLGLLRQDDGFCDRNKTVSLSRAELLTLAEHEPWKLSPNVVLRPLVQERVLPVLAIIGGPGELAYLEQEKPVFAAMGMQQPPVLPRLGGVVMEPPMVRLLGKYGLTYTDVEQGLDTWLEQRLAQADDFGISAAFAGLRTGIQQAYAELTPGLAEIDNQLAELGVKNLHKVLEQVAWLEKRAEASHRQKNRELQLHVNRLETALAPGGMEQQRVHNCLWYLNRYGPGFLKTLLQQPLAENMAIHL